MQASPAFSPPSAAPAFGAGLAKFFADARSSLRTPKFFADAHAKCDAQLARAAADEMGEEEDAVGEVNAPDSQTKIFTTMLASTSPLCAGRTPRTPSYNAAAATPESSALFAVPVCVPASPTISPQSSEVEEQLMLSALSTLRTLAKPLARGKFRPHVVTDISPPVLAQGAASTPANKRRRAPRITAKASPPDTLAPLLGSLVKIKFEQSAGEVWHRAEVVSRSKDSKKATVRYISDGETEQIEFPNKDVVEELTVGADGSIMGIQGAGSRLAQRSQTPFKIEFGNLLRNRRVRVGLRYLPDASLAKDSRVHQRKRARRDTSTASEAWVAAISIEKQVSSLDASSVNSTPTFVRASVEWLSAFAVRFTVAEEVDGRLVQTSGAGNVSIGVRPDDTVCDIDRFFVPESLQGRGHGCRILSLVIAWCWATYPHIRAWRVRAASGKGAGFYRAVGFKLDPAKDWILTAP